MRTLRGRFIMSHILPIALVLPLTGVLLVYPLETQVILADATNDLVAQAGLPGRVADQRPAVWNDPREAAILVAELRPRADTRLDCAASMGNARLQRSGQWYFADQSAQSASRRCAS